MKKYLWMLSAVVVIGALRVKHLFFLCVTAHFNVIVYYEVNLLKFCLMINVVSQEMTVWPIE